MMLIVDFDPKRPVEYPNAYRRRISPTHCILPFRPQFSSTIFGLKFRFKDSNLANAALHILPIRPIDFASDHNQIGDLLAAFLRSLLILLDKRNGLRFFYSKNLKFKLWIFICLGAPPRRETRKPHGTAPASLCHFASRVLQPFSGRRTVLLLQQAFCARAGLERFRRNFKRKANWNRHSAERMIFYY